MESSENESGMEGSRAVNWRSRETVDELERQRAVLEHNLAMMNGQMRKLVTLESHGGNAGQVEIGGEHYLCAAANGHADPLSGEISAFGNFQNLDPAVKEGKFEFAYLVAAGNLKFREGGILTIESPWDRQDQIVRVMTPSVGATDQALWVLHESARMYNGQPGRKEFSAQNPPE